MQPQKVTLNTGTQLSEGCYIQSSVGHYLDAEILRFGYLYLKDHPKAAEWWGLANRYDKEYHLDDSLGETVTEESERVINALNDVTPEGFRWYVNENELFFSRYCGDKEDCSDEMCACNDFH